MRGHIAGKGGHAAPAIVSQNQQGSRFFLGKMILAAGATHLKGPQGKQGPAVFFGTENIISADARYLFFERQPLQNRMVHIFFNQARAGAVDAIVAILHNYRQNLFKRRVGISPAQAGKRFPAADHKQAQAILYFLGKNLQLVPRKVSCRIIAENDGSIVA
ncbi:MAG: hypothetical protein BWY71_02271 [Planctomycetes bacterium ADurb.Bin412]|nr:MAG: hypothetical protein BWY71_02271 [Planctomycetes bacterium ADurb.Bin412]